jgi:transcriptional regulator with XRE-family HTH domain
MSEVVRIHASKQGRRPHYIAAWADKKDLSQADIVRALGVDKGTVSRWFKGSSPTEDYQAKLAELFGTDEEGIFRHPDDDWMRRFLQGREKEEVERIKSTLEAAFPRKRA